jgi:hypothetical protein
MTKISTVTLHYHGFDTAVRMGPGDLRSGCRYRRYPARNTQNARYNTTVSTQSSIKLAMETQILIRLTPQLMTPLPPGRFRFFTTTCKHFSPMAFVVTCRSTRAPSVPSREKVNVRFKAVECRERSKVPRIMVQACKLISGPLRRGRNLQMIRPVYEAVAGSACRALTGASRDAQIKTNSRLVSYRNPVLRSFDKDRSSSLKGTSIVLPVLQSNAMCSELENIILRLTFDLYKRIDDRDAQRPRYGGMPFPT